MLGKQRQNQSHPAPMRKSSDRFGFQCVSRGCHCSVTGVEYKQMSCIAKVAHSQEMRVYELLCPPVSAPACPLRNRNGSF
eukprot:376506-Amphidinium_carterae.1